ncbi:MAG: PDZ domain-containing protein [Planctomycetota bacterium]
MSVCAFLFAASALPISQDSVRPDAVLLRTPDVSATDIVFRYANDLWLVDKRGGVARPLSSPPGGEALPKFSPDGKQVACIGSYEGGGDLYVLDLEGGVPRRVTHHPGGELLCDWTPDGRALLFSSSRRSGQQRAPKLFTVPAQGGEPTALPIPYGLFGAIEGSWLAYTPVSNAEFRTWKRYQGGLAQDIWLFQLDTFEARRLTDFPGTDAQPMWHAGEVYFLSDRDPSARMNLWKCDVRGQNLTAVTTFTDADVRFPSVGPADIVFEHAGKLKRYEFASGRTVSVDIAIPGDRPKLVSETRSVEDDVQSISIGAHGRRAVVEARGDVFSVPVGEGVTRNLTRSDGVAERAPSTSHDGQWVAYLTDRSGEYEFAVRRADGRAFRWANAGDEVEEKILTAIGPGWKEGPIWSPDDKSLAFVNHAGELWHIAVDSGALSKLATNPLGFTFGFEWSPDSRWIAFACRHPETKLSGLYVYDLQAKSLHSLTSGRFDDREPSFDKSGKWLYYASSRTFEPIYSEFDESFVYANTANVMAVPLRGDVKNVFAPSDPSEQDDEDESGDEQDADAKKDADTPDASKAAKDDAEKDSSDAPKPVAIDLEGFEARVIQLPVPAGAIGSLAGGDEKVFYLRGPRAGSAAPPSDDDEEEGETGGSDLVQFALSKSKQEREEKKVLGGVAGFELTANAKRAFVELHDERYATIDASPDAEVDDEDVLDLAGLRCEIDPRREWSQILADAYRVNRDFFYEPTLHGVDWRGIYDRYQRALVDATSRDDLHYLLGEMIAELNVGHAYNVGGPGIPESGPQGATAGLLGCDYELVGDAYRIRHILRGGDGEIDGRSPLAEPGIDVREGDYLLAIDGARVDVSRDVEASLLGKANRPTEITVNAAPRLDGSERRVVVVPIESEGELRYREWVEENRKLVDTLSGGRIGYVHVPDTGRRGQRELVRQFMSQFHKDALLVDERWNGGGQIPTRFIELLNRPRTNSWAVRYGEDWVWPPVSHDGPKAMLINGSAGSGGDAFPYYFRQARLGPLIGMRTWGGLVGISGNPTFIDGSSVTVPRFAFYENDGTWGVEGYGVAPDIEVVDDPSQMVHGEDPQLLAGVKYLQQQLESWKFVRPSRPASPNRAGAGVPVTDR